MTQNTKDIYTLIMSPVYVMKYKPVDGQICDHISYNLFNSITPDERIQIKIYDKYMEIYKTKSMNSEYYEQVRTTNQRGKKTMQRFKKLLFTKSMVAMVQHINSL